MTSAEKEGKTTNYVYDSAGNLLSATSSENANTSSAQTSLVQSEDIIEGWTAYQTTGMSARYETTTIDVKEGTLPAEETPAVEEAAPAEETPAVEEEVPAEETPAVEEEVPAEETPAVEEAAPAEEAPAVEEAAPAKEAPVVEEDTPAVSDTQLEVVVQRLSLNADRTGGANIYRDMPVQEGISYTYRGQLKSDQMRDAVVQVVVNYYDIQQRLIRHDNVINVKQDSDWKTYNTNLIAPSGAVTARVHLQIVLLQANGQATAEFADRTFEQVVSQGGQS
ncbi:hypothetical protein [Saccharibacillus sacchari]|uniref:hypothetical protein n=1 Tax=Saccharibacillus sacchari TaxID=456493 RepID=UPI00147211F5